MASLDVKSLFMNIHWTETFGLQVGNYYIIFIKEFFSSVIRITMFELLLI